METTQSVGGGEAAAQLPFADVRPPPPPQTRGRLWVASQPREAHEGWPDRCPFHLETPARAAGQAPWALLAREGRAPCQSGRAKNTRQR